MFKGYSQPGMQKGGRKGAIKERHNGAAFIKGQQHAAFTEENLVQRTARQST